MTEIASSFLFPINPILVGPFVPPILVGGGQKGPPPLKMSLKTKFGKNPGQKS